MRDILLTLVVLGALPYVLKNAYKGVLLWSWLGYMNPHRMTWGFAYSFPFAQLAALTTLVALPFDKGRKGIPITSVTVCWFLLVLWMNLSTLFAFNPEEAYSEWDRAMKIMLISFVTVMLMQDEKRLNALVWTIAFSLGFFGIKGGIFSILTGGNYLVFGPAESFIRDNNALALALIMTLPLVRYLHLQATHRYVRLALLGSMGLIFLSIMTSHSRGAFIAGAAMVMYIWLKGRQKLKVGLAILLLLPFTFFFMPDHWFERMGTISTYQEDDSAMGRINAWWFAFNLAKDHPLVGGGFNTFTPELFRIYAPEQEDFHDAHSIYFEVLGEQGFVGLGLFLALGALSLLTARRTAKMAKQYPQLLWARDLASLVQVSLVGYAVGGAFLGLAYFDFYYHLVAIVVVLQAIVRQQIAAGFPEPVPDDAVADVPDDNATEGTGKSAPGVAVAGDRT